jgi:hypothetical protein
MSIIKIALCNSAGELDATHVETDGDVDMAVTLAVIALIEGTPLGDGDSITITEIEGA